MALCILFLLVHLQKMPQWQCLEYTVFVLSEDLDIHPIFIAPQIKILI